MSHYTGYYGRVIVREEYRELIEGRLIITDTSDPVFMLYKNLDDEERFDLKITGLNWTKWEFDKESGLWDFHVEYNERKQGTPHDNLIDYFIPYIAEEVIEMHYWDEYDPSLDISSSLTSSLRQQIEHREETIMEICKELKSYKQ